MQPDRPSALVGILLVRGAGAPLVQRRLPRRTTATVGRRDRNAWDLAPEWVPRELAVFTPAEEGWLVTNGTRLPMRVENDWIRAGAAVFQPHAVVMLQRGEHRIGWEGLPQPVSLSVSIRTRKLEDQRIPYAVDSAIDAAAPGMGSYLGVEEAPMSAAMRYRLATLYRHLLDGEPEPAHLLHRRAEQLGIPEADLEAVAHKHRRRLNAVRGLDLQSVEELGDYLVRSSGELTKADLDP